jgi:cell division protease FtsH
VPADLPEFKPTNLEVEVSSNWRRNGFVYLLILIAAAAIALNVFPAFEKPEEVDITTVAKWAAAGDIASITVTDDDTLLVQRTRSETPVVSLKEPGMSLPETFLALGVPEDRLDDFELEVTPPSAASRWVSLAVNLLPFLFAGLLVFFLIRQAQGTNNQAMSFGRSRARVFTGDRPTVTFEDVAGVEEAKEELQEVVEFLKEPQKFTALGARVPKGVLLVGAPGTGKTLLAKAVSGEAGVPFFSISGSEFVEMFVGVGASRVRDLFNQAKRNSPCIVFVDELDAVGRHRGAGLGGSHDEREQTLNQILVEMDGFDTDTNIIILAATNRPDILDPALMRPGRFDRRVVLDRPDVRGREAILQVHVRGKPLAPDVDLAVLARGTPGFVGADIENLVNEAAILAARQQQKTIAMADFQEAVERVVAGPERRSRLISDEEKEIIAYHEAGHALVQSKLPLCDPVHKVSIISRGMALGYTMPLPERDRVLESRSRLKDQIAGLLGGRVAEQITFGGVTTGAANDLERATSMARRMVTEYGMSEKLGPLVFGEKEELIFLGREISEQRNYSEEVAETIDAEIRHIVDEAFARAKEVISASQDKLIEIAQKLMQVETLEGQQLRAILAA